MKTKILFPFLLFAVHIHAQSLQVYSGSITGNTVIQTSDIFEVTFKIKNISSSYYPESYAGIRISTHSDKTNLVSLGFVSIEGLNAGQISNPVQYKLPLPYTIPSGSTWYVYIVADNFGSNSSISSAIGTITVNQNAAHTSQNIPYPILFIHGLVGDDASWIDFADSTLNKQYGWSNGGVLDFCLNQDGNKNTGELYNDFHDYVKTQYLKAADYYFINFDVDNTGDWMSYTCHNCNDPVQSNESAIVKQGFAVRQAISYILSITGRDQVILVGHSMGGLAAREYLQNWKQADGYTHVAKLVTVGTPHQGSNSGLWLNGFNILFTGIDENSEACRDLRNSYSTGNPGTYLLGGNENPGNYYTVSPYYNVDVNCNGWNFNATTSSYDNNAGLDYMPFPDINYSGITGTGDSHFGGTGSNGDGVVEDWSSYLWNVPSFNNYVDTFTIIGNTPFGDALHCHLHKSEYGQQNIQALDEPDFFDEALKGHAYTVDVNKLYYGTIAAKSQTSYFGNTTDYDDYKFIVNTASGITINVYNITVPTMSVSVYSSDQKLYSPVITNGGSGNISFTLSNVPAGAYYMEIAGIPTTNPPSWYRAYGFEIKTQIQTNVAQLPNSDFTDMNLFPNPCREYFNISIASSVEGPFTMQVVNMFGQVIYREEKIYKGVSKVNTTGIASGMYAVTISNGDQSVTKNILINK